jgi:hypothetical protein
MTIRERMKAGHLYTDMGEGLEEERQRCKELTHDYNLTRPSEGEKRKALLKQLLGSCGDSIWIEPPLHMAYGKNVHIGEGFYANFNLVLVDDGDIYIGDNVMIAPNVTISPTGHPVHPDLRRGGQPVFHSHQNRRRRLDRLECRHPAWRNHRKKLGHWRRKRGLEGCPGKRGRRRQSMPRLARDQ